MSTTEALRTHLDAVPTEFNKLQAENVKLKEDNHDGATMLKLEGELSETQAENVRLAQRLSVAQQRANEPEAVQANQTAAADEAAAGMEAERDDLRRRLANSSEKLEETTEALCRATQRAETAEQHDVELERTIEREKGEAELVRLRTVAAEARKWEEREARLVRWIDELTHESTTAAGGRLGVGGGVGVAGASDGERRQLEVTAASIPELAATSEERYVMTDGMGGTGEVLSAPACDKPGNVHDKGGVTLGTKRLAAGTVGRATFRVEVLEFVPCGRHTSSLSTGTPPPASGFSLSSGTLPLATPTPVTRPPPPTAGATTMDASYGHGEAVVPVPTLAAAPLDALSRTLLAQQLPPLPNFTGDHMDGDVDGESFQEWLERLEMVAATCHWDDQTKLVNIATRL